MTGRRVDRDESAATWLILLGMWMVLLLPMVFEPTPRVVGAHMMSAIAASLLFAVLAWRLGLNALTLNEWLMAPTAVALIVTLDAGAVRGSVVGYAGLAALIAPFVRHLAKGR